MTQPYSIYIHTPFCRHRCAYCDFNTYAGQEGSIPTYVDALIREAEIVAASAPERLSVHTLFFGGGTPSLLSAPQLASIMNALRAALMVSPDIEASLEANPGTTSRAYLHKLRAIGFNRLSYGVQSANPEELHMLERTHDFFDVVNSVTWARQAGFDNLNLDLIFGLPEQTLIRWQETLKRVLDLAPEHLSLYSLTLEHGTPFGRWAQRGLLPMPDPDLAADMYEWAGETLKSAGYLQYEISNWAKPGRECRHNLQYWRGLPYLGLGAGAHGYANDVRYSNALRIKTYIERLKPENRSLGIGFPFTPAMVNRHHQTPQDDMGEFMMTGLRLTHEGVSPVIFRTRFEQELHEVFGKEIDALIRLDLLEWANAQTLKVNKSLKVLRLTPHGRLLGNQVFMRFVS